MGAGAFLHRNQCSLADFIGFPAQADSGGNQAELRLDWKPNRLNEAKWEIVNSA